MLESFWVADRRLGAMGKTDTKREGPGWHPSSFTERLDSGGAIHCTEPLVPDL